MPTDPRMFLIPLFTAIVGSSLFYALGQQVHVSYGIHLIHVEIEFAVLGLLIGYFLGASLVPKPARA